MPKITSDPKKLLKKSARLNHLDMQKVASHVQREKGEWIQNTIMLDGYNVPFKYQRKKHYQSLKGNRVNITFYAEVEDLAGLEFEVMRVVRVRVA